MDGEIIHSWCFHDVECFDSTPFAAIIILDKDLKSFFEPQILAVISCALGAMEYMRTPIWNLLIISYHLYIILPPHEIHE